MLDNRNETRLKEMYMGLKLEMRIFQEREYCCRRFKSISVAKVRNMTSLEEQGEAEGKFMVAESRLNWKRKLRVF
jgi:hypothetical protein